MQCNYCGSNMGVANMSGTYHCSNKACTRSPEEPKQSNNEEVAALQARIEKLEVKLAKLENDMFYLKGQHGRC